MQTTRIQAIMTDRPTASQYVLSFGMLVALLKRTSLDTTGISLYTCLFITATDSQTSSCKTARNIQCS